jgi:uncharacterized protein YaiL (DUF2058 family)
MSTSLRDQLLQAGLVNERQPKEAERQLRRQQRERLSRGEIAIVRRNGGYELVPAETAVRIRERDERAVIGCGVAPDAVTTDGVPEDLMW